MKTTFDKEFKRGYDSARRAISDKAYTVQELLNQSKSDLHKDLFNKGWKEACYDALSASDLNNENHD